MRLGRSKERRGHTAIAARDRAGRGGSVSPPALYGGHARGVGPHAKRPVAVVLKPHAPSVQRWSLKPHISTMSMERTFRSSRRGPAFAADRCASGTGSQSCSAPLPVTRSANTRTGVSNEPPGSSHALLARRTDLGLLLGLHHDLELADPLGVFLSWSPPATRQCPCCHLLPSLSLHFVCAP